jgi:hypothetical protein
MSKADGRCLGILKKKYGVELNSFSYEGIVNALADKVQRDVKAEIQKRDGSAPFADEHSARLRPFEGILTDYATDLDKLKTQLGKTIGPMEKSLKAAKRRREEFAFEMVNRMAMIDNDKQRKALRDRQRALDEQYQEACRAIEAVKSEWDDYRYRAIVFRDYARAGLTPQLQYRSTSKGRPLLRDIKHYIEHPPFGRWP